MSEVRLERVSKVYPNGHVAVQDATFRVADGELFVLVRPSGCGKSTLLRMIAGLEPITSGTRTMAYAPERLHFFDAATGARIETA